MGDLKIVKASDCNSETTQTPGMSRLAGISLETAGSERLWMGFVTMKGGAKSGAHHHGHCGSGIYIIRGHARFRWGERLENMAEAGPGDFIYPPSQNAPDSSRGMKAKRVSAEAVSSIRRIAVLFW